RFMQQAVLAPWIRVLFILSLVGGGLLLSWFSWVEAQPAPARKPGAAASEDPFSLPAQEREVNPLGDVPENQPRTPPIREQDLPEREIGIPQPEEERRVPQLPETETNTPTVEQPVDIPPREEQAVPTEPVEAPAPPTGSVGTAC